MLDSDWCFCAKLLHGNALRPDTRPVNLTRVLAAHRESASRLLVAFPEIEASWHHFGNTDLLLSFLDRIWPVSNRTASIFVPQTPAEGAGYCSFVCKFAITDRVVSIGGGIDVENAKKSALLHALFMLLEGRVPSLPEPAWHNLRSLPIPPPRSPHPPPLGKDAVETQETTCQNSRSQFSKDALDSKYSKHRLLLAQHGFDTYLPAQLAMHLDIEPPWLVPELPSDGTHRISAQTATYRCIGEGRSFVKARNAAYLHAVYLAVDGQIPSRWHAIANGTSPPRQFPSISDFPIAQLPTTRDSWNTLIFGFVSGSAPSHTRYLDAPLDSTVAFLPSQMHPDTPLSNNSCSTQPPQPPTLPSSWLALDPFRHSPTPTPLPPSNLSALAAPASLTAFLTPIPDGKSRPTINQNSLAAAFRGGFDPHLVDKIRMHPLLAAWIDNPVAAVQMQLWIKNRVLITPAEKVVKLDVIQGLNGSVSVATIRVPPAQKLGVGDDSEHGKKSREVVVVESGVDVSIVVRRATARALLEC